jgi:hypothetical protein
VKKHVLWCVAAAVTLGIACSKATAPTGGGANGSTSVSADLTALIATLGGDTSVLAIYDARDNVTRASGQVTTWGDARGPGFGPPLVPTRSGTKYLPLYNGNSGPILFNSVDSNALRTTTPSPLFDLSRPLTLVYVGSVTNASSGWASLAIVSDSINPPARVLAIGSKGYPTIFAIAGARRTIDLNTRVRTSGTGTVSDTSRLIVVTNNGTAISAQIDNAPDTVDVDGCGQHDGFCGTAAGPGPNYLTIGAMFAGPSTQILNGSPLVNDVIILDRVLTPTDYAALSCWAVKYRGIQVVGTAPACS